MNARWYLHRIGFLLAAALALVFILFPLKAWADTYSMTDMNGKLMISTTQPCKIAGWFAKWKAATWVFKGKPYDACWTVQPTEDGRRQIVIIDSSGIVSSHYPGVFRKDEGV